jgi:hypothetical protein
MKISAIMAHGEMAALMRKWLAFINMAGESGENNEIKKMAL